MKAKLILSAAAILVAGILPAQETEPQVNSDKNKKTTIIVATATTVLAGGVLLFHKLFHKQEIPQVVKDAAKAKFPNATEFEEWEFEDGVYEVEVEQGEEKEGEENEAEAKFSPDGTWLQTKQYIKSSTLPAAALASISAEYKDWKMSDYAKKVETPEGGEVYVVEVEKGRKEEMKLTLSADGKIIKSEKDDD